MSRRDVEHQREAGAPTREADEAPALDGRAARTALRARSRSLRRWPSRCWPAGWVVAGHRAGNPGTADSVDAGFAWDMAVHHQQAVTMAYPRPHTERGVKTLAYDIETSQFNQVGQMQGWLDSVGLPPQNPNTPMSWMAGMTGMNMHAGSDG